VTELMAEQLCVVFPAKNASRFVVFVYSGMGRI
jgi:hypothetical protein